MKWIGNEHVTYTMSRDNPPCERIAAGETVEEARRAAARQMFEFMTGKIGMDKEEAGMLLTMTGDLAICQTVNPMKTVRMEFPKYITAGYGFHMEKVY